MFNCCLCDSDEWTTTGLCEICNEIAKIVACYNSKEILNTLRKVYLRDKEKCENKATAEKIEKVKTRSQTHRPYI